MHLHIMKIHFKAIFFSVWFKWECTFADSDRYFLDLIYIFWNWFVDETELWIDENDFEGTGRFGFQNVVDLF